MKTEIKLARPGLEAYQALFETTGWNRDYQLSLEELGRALDGSQFFAAAYDGERLIGFGRVLTDGSMHAMIFDLIVHPDYQHQGLGSQILQQLIQWCNAARIHDIQLFCARGKRAFYERNGFLVRPDVAPGMQYRKPA